MFNANKRNLSVRLIDMIDEKPPEFQGSEAPFDDAIIIIIKQMIKLFIIP